MDEKMNSYRHYYLYAKHHYRRSGDIIADLKRIHSEWCGLKAEDIDEWDIINVMTTEIYKHMNEYQFGKLISGLEPLHWDGRRDDRPFALRLLEKYLTILALTEVKKIEGALGKPDPSILPTVTQCDHCWDVIDDKKKMIYVDSSGKEAVLCPDCWVKETNKVQVYQREAELFP